MVSQGVPMLLGRDERARTQRGNNNACSRADEFSWYDWSPDAAADEPDADVLLVLNAEAVEHAFVVPGPEARTYTLLLDTGIADGVPPTAAGFAAGSTVVVAPRTVLVAAAAQ